MVHFLIKQHNGGILKLIKYEILTISCSGLREFVNLYCLSSQTLLVPLSKVSGPIWGFLFCYPQTRLRLPPTQTTLTVASLCVYFWPIF